MREPYTPRVLAGLAGLLEAGGWRAEGGEVVRPAWHARAACRGVGAEAFFPPGGRGDKRRLALSYRDVAGRYCAGCPVVSECLAAGEHEDHGLWGGASPGQRRRRRRVA